MYPSRNTWMLPLECVFCCTRLTVHFLFEVKFYPNTVFHEKITECQFLCGYIKIIIFHQNLYLSVSFYEFYILKLYLIWREEMFEADFRFEFFSLKYFLCKNNFVWAFFKESHSIDPPPLSLENSNSLTLHGKITKNRTRTSPGKQNYPSDPNPHPFPEIFLDPHMAYSYTTILGMNTKYSIIFHI